MLAPLTAAGAFQYNLRFRNTENPVSPHRLKRREFIALTGSALAAWPTCAQTLPGKLRLGFVHPISPKDLPPYYVAFVGRLRELGYVEGDTLAVEYINLEGHVERYDEAMRELVRRRVDLIYALGQEQNLRAALAATSTIPIVMMAIGYDPLAKGYVTSLARPTGNATGVYVLSVEVTKKRLQLFRDAFPATRAAFGFWDFDSAEIWRIAVDAAPVVGLTLAGIELRALPYDYELAFAQVAPEYRDAMFAFSSAIFVPDANRLAAFALHHRIPSCFDHPRFVDAGGLMAYAADFNAAARRAAELADRIARGAKPSDLPIEQSTKFVLKINLKTAAALGITMSPTILALADEVVE
jgi:putative ABC transport system substrate-binding protein